MTTYIHLGCQPTFNAVFLQWDGHVLPSYASSCGNTRQFNQLLLSNFMRCRSNTPLVSQYCSPNDSSIRKCLLRPSITTGPHFCMSYSQVSRRNCEGLLRARTLSPYPNLKPPTFLSFSSSSCRLSYVN